MKKSRKFYKEGKKFLLSGATIALLDFWTVNNQEVVHAAKVQSRQTKVAKKVNIVSKTNTLKLKKRPKIIKHHFQSKKVKKQNLTDKRKEITSGSTANKKSKTRSNSFKSEVLKNQQMKTVQNLSVQDQNYLNSKTNVESNKDSYDNDNKSEVINRKEGVSSPNTVVVDPNNYLNYFQQNGSAAREGNYTTYTDKDGASVGKQVLTSGSNQAGNVTFRDPIDLNQDFVFEGSMNFGTTTTVGNDTGIADGIGFAFYTGEKNQVGKTGGNLGINGIPNAIGWKFDTWYNDGVNTGPVNGTNDVEISSKDEAYGAFVSTDKNGLGSVDTTNASLFKVPLSYVNQGQDNPVLLKYIANDHTLTVTITINGQKYTSSRQIQFDNTNQYLFFTISASTGVLPTKQLFTIKKFIYASKPQAKFVYKDIVENKWLDEYSHTEIGTAGNEIFPDKNNNNHDKTINRLEELGYEVVSDEFKPGDKFQDSLQNFVVSLKHKTQKFNPGENIPGTDKNDDANLIKEVKQTIKYVGDPSPLPANVQPADNVQIVRFTRYGTVDLVTHKVILPYGPWTPASQTLKDVNSPEISGYMADQKVVVGTEVNPDSQDIIKVVKYTNNTADEQKAIIEYQDVDDSNKVVTTDTVSGTVGHKIPLDKHDKTIGDLEKLGYEVVSDEFTTGGEKNFQDSTQKFVVKLKHKTQKYNPGENIPGTDKNDDVNLIKEVKQTIKYVGDPSPLPASVQPADNVQTVRFTRYGTVDLVTHKVILPYGPWTPESQTLKDVNSPEISGYVADQKVVVGTKVNPASQDIIKVVKYTKIQGGNGSSNSSTGSNGSNGSNGINGSNGSNGSNGINGSNGSNSSNGSSGSNGLNGKVDRGNKGGFNNTVNSQKNNDSNNPNAESQRNKLPKTGKEESSNLSLLALGSLMLVGTLGNAVYRYIKRKKEN